MRQMDRRGQTYIGTRIDEKESHKGRREEERVVMKREFVAAIEHPPACSGGAPPRLALEPFSDYLIENEDM